MRLPPNTGAWAKAAHHFYLFLACLLGHAGAKPLARAIFDASLRMPLEDESGQDERPS